MEPIVHVRTISIWFFSLRESLFFFSSPNHEQASLGAVVEASCARRIKRHTSERSAARTSRVTIKRMTRETKREREREKVAERRDEGRGSKGEVLRGSDRERHVVAVTVSGTRTTITQPEGNSRTQRVARITATERALPFASARRERERNGTHYGWHTHTTRGSLSLLPQNGALARIHTPARYTTLCLYVSAHVHARTVKP